MNELNPAPTGQTGQCPAEQRLPDRLVETVGREGLPFCPLFTSIQSLNKEKTFGMFQ